MSQKFKNDDGALFTLGREVKPGVVCHDHAASEDCNDTRSAIHFSCQIRQVTEAKDEGATDRRL